MASQAASIIALQACIGSLCEQGWSQDGINQATRAFYSDDFAKSFATEDEAVTFMTELTRGLSERSFVLRRFESNSEAVQKSLNEISQSDNADEEVNVLGIGWDKNKDILNSSTNWSSTRQLRIRKERHFPR